MGKVQVGRWKFIVWWLGMMLPLINSQTLNGWVIIHARIIYSFTSIYFSCNWESCFLKLIFNSSRNIYVDKELLKNFWFWKNMEEKGFSFYSFQKKENNFFSVQNLVLLFVYTPSVGLCFSIPLYSRVLNNFVFLTKFSG